MKPLFLLLSLTIMITSCLNETKQGSAEKLVQPKHRVLSLEKFEKKLSEEDIQLVDVRTPNEYGSGHIEGAINANVLDPNFPVDLVSKTDTSKQVMIYCRSGKRAHRAAKMMEEMGYPIIYDLEGGYLAWKRKE